MVVGRQGAVFVHHVDEHLGAVRGQPFRGDGRLAQLPLHRPLALQKRLRVGQRHAARAAQGDRLQVLGAHDRAHPGAARGAVQVVHDAGEADEILPGRADAGDDRVRHAEFRAQLFLRLPNRLAPQVRGIPDFDPVVVDPDVRRGFRLALQNEQVVAGEFHLGSPEAARVGGGDGVGERALGDDHVARAARRVRAGQRAGREDHLVVRAERVDGRVQFFGQIFDAQPAAADVVPGPFRVERLLGDRSRGQVDAEDGAGPAGPVRCAAHASPPCVSCVR